MRQKERKKQMGNRWNTPPAAQAPATPMAQLIPKQPNLISQNEASYMSLPQDSNQSQLVVRYSMAPAAQAPAAPAAPAAPMPKRKPNMYYQSNQQQMDESEGARMTNLAQQSTQQGNESMAHAPMRMLSRSAPVEQYIDEDMDDDDIQQGTTDISCDKLQALNDLVESMNRNSTCPIKFNKINTGTKAGWPIKWIRVQRIDGRAEGVQLRDITCWRSDPSKAVRYVTSVWPAFNPSTTPSARVDRSLFVTGISRDHLKPAYIELCFEEEYDIVRVTVSFGPTIDTVSESRCSGVSVQFFDRNRRLMFEWTGPVAKSRDLKYNFQFPFVTPSRLE